MKIKKLLLAAIILLLIFVPSACSNKSDTKVVLITGKDGKNGSYTDKATYEALEALSKEYKFNLEVIEPSKVQNYDKKFVEIISQSPQLIIYSNPSSETEAVIAAKNYNDIYFVLVGANADMDLDGIQDVNNIYSIVFSKSETGFISGIYAANTAQKNICFLGGREYLSIVEYEASFLSGVKCVSQDKAVKVLYLGDNQSYETITSKLNDAINDDYDIIYTIEQSQAVYDFAKQKGIKVIGCGYNYDASYNYKMSFLVKNNVNNAITCAVKEYFNGTFQGQIKIFGFEDDALSLEYSDSNDTAKNNVETWKDRISEKSFHIPVNRSEAASFIAPEFK